MKVIGFNFNKFFTERTSLSENYQMNTNIEFTDVIEENVPMLKDLEAVKISFVYSIKYTSEKPQNKQFGELNLAGEIVLALSQEESKNLLKSWKKKQLPGQFQISLFNLIMRKSTPKAVFLAEEVALPSPIQIPKLKAEKQPSS